MMALLFALRTRLDQIAAPTLATFARLLFAAILLGYFWNSALTKVGPGPFGVFHPSVGGYAQIWPRAMEAVGYDISQLGGFHWAVVVAGTLAELILPALITLGFLTRLAAFAMIGFVAVQSLTDIWGHMVSAATTGRWFDTASDSLIADQRAFWVLLLMTSVLHGAGPLSLDRLLFGSKPRLGAASATILA